MNKKYPVGIDLGTSCSCIGLWKDGIVKILQDDKKNRTMPSYVAYTDGAVLIGHDAYNQAHTNSQNTIYAAKRMLGKDYSDPALQANLKNWPFSVIKADKNKPFIQVQFQNKPKKVEPVEISCHVLKKLKALAEAEVGEGNVTHAVITVPAYFDHAQIDATIKAGRIAGFKEIKTISEPTAAAIAYGLDQKTKKEETIVVFDMGAGTLDVTLMTVTDQKFVVLATNGDTNLGGNDFDNRLFDHFYQIFENEIKDNQRAKASLRLHCEKIKKVLSTNAKSEEFVLTLDGGKELKCSITREKFEQICADLFQSCLVPLQKVMEDNKSKKKIDQIVLAGGMTRVPKIVQLVKDFFVGVSVNNSINADEAIAYGATIKAAVAYGVYEENIFDFLLMDVTPLSLGVAVKGGIMSVVIPRNTTIPIQMEQIFETIFDNQSAAYFNVYQGERELTKDNKFLGKFTIHNLPLKPKGEVKFRTSFDISSNGTLEVTAVETTETLTNKIIITKESRDLTQEDVERLIIEADACYTIDKNAKEKIQARLDLQEFCYTLKKLVTNEKKIRQPDKDSFFKALMEVEIWANQCEDLTSKICEIKKKDLNFLFTSIVEKNSNMTLELIGKKASALRLEDLD